MLFRLVASEPDAITKWSASRFFPLTLIVLLSTKLAHPFMRVANLQTHLAHCIIDAMVSHFKAVHPDVSDDPLKALKHKDERLRITSKIDLFNP